MKATTQHSFSRRHFLAGLSLLPWATSSLANRQNQLISNEVYLNGHHDQAGNFFMSSLDRNGLEQYRLPLPEMPHGFAIHPKQKSLVVTFPGLTGTKLSVMDFNQGKQIAEISIRAGHHFNGHGTFSPDGSLLFATENVIKNSEGKIGVYDGKTYEFIRELPAYGLGPHGMRILPDGKTLVIANGGIKTHPETGKFYFDMNTMQSSIAFVDVKTGELIAKRQIPVHRLSIRNIYFAGNDRLLVTCQYYGKREMPKVVGLIELTASTISEIEMLDIDEDNLWLMNNYTGGTIVEGDIAAVSCPRGNHLTFWDLQQKRFISSVKIPDVSGIQPLGDGKHFIASADIGKLYKINYQTSEVTPFQSWQNAKWTNHMVKTIV